jgi:glycosyltransferase involved in cell wall biosynthesis
VRVSIIVPAYNEAGNIPLLVQELVPAVAGLEVEIIIVDDGSTDGTSHRVPDGPPFRCVRQSHEGKTAALRRGFAEASGDVVVTIDADLQEDPQHIHAMLTLLEEHDCVLGIRSSRTDSLIGKKLPSRLYNGLIRLWFGRNFRDINCGLRAFRRDALGNLVYFPGAHRLFPLMVHRAGGSVRLMPVRHQPRRFEEAKYSSPMRFFPAVADLIRLRRMMP